jgi:hypothetical protein
MTVRTQPALAQAPEWLVTEMPPGYQTRFHEIQRLSADLHAMERIGCVLWATGQPLRDAVGAVFGAIKCEVDAAQGPAGPIAVKLGESRRLLFFVSDADGPVEKTNEELAQAFQTVQFAGPEDRVVFVGNNDPAKPPAARPEPVLPDALGVLHRMGVNVVMTATLFNLWQLALDNPQKARTALEHLHQQDGGPFVIPAR